MNGRPESFRRGARRRVGENKGLLPAGQDRLLMTAIDAEHGRELWSVVADLTPGWGAVLELVVFGDRLYLMAALEKPPPSPSEETGHRRLTLFALDGVSNGRENRCPPGPEEARALPMRQQSDGVVPGALQG